MTTDTSENGLEALIVADMTGRTAAPASSGLAEEPEPFVGLHNWLLGDPRAYDRVWTVDLVQLRAFIAATQPPLLCHARREHSAYRNSASRFGLATSSLG
jgi:type I restriction enzyme, R subunit